MSLGAEATALLGGRVEPLDPDVPQEGERHSRYVRRVGVTRAPELGHAVCHPGCCHLRGIMGGDPGVYDYAWSGARWMSPLCWPPEYRWLWWIEDCEDRAVHELGVLAEEARVDAQLDPALQRRWRGELPRGWRGDSSAVRARALEDAIQRIKARGPHG